MFIYESVKSFLVVLISHGHASFIHEHGTIILFKLPVLHIFHMEIVCLHKCINKHRINVLCTLFLDISDFDIIRP